MALLIASCQPYSTPDKLPPSPSNSSLTTTSANFVTRFLMSEVVIQQNCIGDKELEYALERQLPATGSHALLPRLPNSLAPKPARADRADVLVLTDVTSTNAERKEDEEREPWRQEPALVGVHGKQTDPWHSVDIKLETMVKDHTKAASTQEKEKTLNDVITHSKDLMSELDDAINTKIVAKIEELFPKCESGVAKRPHSMATQRLLEPKHRSDFPTQFANCKVWYEGLKSSAHGSSREHMDSLLDKLIPMWAALKPVVDAESPNKDTVLDIKPKTTWK
ncbi:hypothetical protein BD410DRAFT_846366 [Rickenella mellea]|uniref:Uncharacterized protein n=1 Tax=Rickenella mellea TaxID=50990 RepID=A0A4Y7PHQ8_9AGAM|nr:hypothetical protein BD410DRAFT_846366 [Rickenella mellea]